MVKFDRHTNENGVRNSTKTSALTDLKISFKIFTESEKKGQDDLTFFFFLIKKKRQAKQMGDISDLCLPKVKHQRVLFLFFILNMGVEID